MANTTKIIRDLRDEIDKLQFGANPAGTVWYVDSVNGDAAFGGRQADRAFLTLVAAIAASAANDTIVVLPGHAEAITSATSHVVSKALSIIGVGSGSNKPNFTVGTATTALMSVTASSLIKNLRFTAGIDSVEAMLSLGVNDVIVEDCDFRDGGAALEWLSAIFLVTTFDHFQIRRCTFWCTLDPAGTHGGVNTGCIYCVASDDILVEDCTFGGNIETGFFHNKTTAATSIVLRRISGTCALATAFPIVQAAGCTGTCVDSSFSVPASAAVVETALFGVLGTSFGMAHSEAMNDGGAGAGGAAIAATCS